MSKIKNLAKVVTNIIEVFLLAITILFVPLAESGKPGSGGNGPGGGGSGGGTSASFSGQAIGLKASITALNITLSDTGALPSSGGALETSLLTASVPPLITAGLFHSTTIGKEDVSRAEATVAGLNLSLTGLSLSADFIMSTTRAQCIKSKPSSSGNAMIANLTINGKSIAVTGAPNQTVNLLGVKVVINEQIKPSSGDITVNALHITVKDILTGIVTADIVISSSHSDITCGKVICSTDDFVTGGGWITGPSNAKANFGVGGGLKKGALWGHLVYIDHGTGMKVKGTELTGYHVTGPTSRMITGTATINGVAGTYTIDVADNGEPSTYDTFTIQLSNGYTATGNLSGGNIQLHGTSCK